MTAALEAAQINASVRSLMVHHGFEVHHGYEVQQKCLQMRTSTQSVMCSTHSNSYNTLHHRYDADKKALLRQQL